MTNVAEFSLQGESDSCKTVLASLESLSTSDPVFIALVTCDVLLSSKDWTTSWASSLSSATSASSLADNLLSTLGLDKEEILSSLKKEGSKAKDIKLEEKNQEAKEPKESNPTGCSALSVR